jgi:hypothetical protein
MRVLLLGNFGLVPNNIGKVDDAGQVAIFSAPQSRVIDEKMGKGIAQ